MLHSERKKDKAATHSFHAALMHCSAAPRKSWLGRHTPLTAIQSAWIKSLLTTWADSYGGKTSQQMRIEGKGADLFAGMREEGWSESRLNEITEVMNKLRGEGVTGQALLTSASLLLFPGMLSKAIDKAYEQENAEFIEAAILEAFNIHDPVFIIGRRYYTRRQSISKLSRKLQELAPWLTDKMARDRVKWCLQIFRAKTFLSVKKNIQMNK